MKKDGVLFIFENEEEAYDYAKKWLAKLSLSYIPEEQRAECISDALSRIHWEIVFKRVDWASSDIGNRLGEMMGDEVLSYLEYRDTGRRLNDNVLEKDEL